MKLKLPALVLFLSFSTAFSNPGNVWLNSFEDAQKLAIATNKLIFVDFTAPWCAPCRKMEREAFSDPEISALMQNYVLLKVDFDNNMSMRSRYGVKGIPYAFIIDSQGEIVNKQLGYTGKDEVQKLLKAYAINTAYLQREHSLYIQNKNYVTALRLAQQYLDFGLFNSKNIRPDLFRLAGVYLKNAEKLLEKDQANYEMMVQKIELLKITSDLYAGRFKRVNRKISKFREEEILEENKSRFVFLHYVLAAEAKRADAESWEQEVKSFGNGDKLLEKSEKLLNEES